MIDEPEPRIECSRCQKRFDLSETYCFGPTSACMDCVQDEIDDVMGQWNKARFERDEARRERDAAQRQIYAIREAAQSVIDWHDTLDGDMDNQFGNDAIDRLKAALAGEGGGA